MYNEVVHHSFCIRHSELPCYYVLNMGNIEFLYLTVFGLLDSLQETVTSAIHKNYKFFFIAIQIYNSPVFQPDGLLLAFAIEKVTEDLPAFQKI